MRDHSVSATLQVRDGTAAAAQNRARVWSERLRNRVERLGRLIDMDAPQGVVDQEGWLIVKAACELYGLPLPEADA